MSDCSVQSHRDYKSNLHPQVLYKDSKCQRLSPHDPRSPVLNHNCTLGSLSATSNIRALSRLASTASLPPTSLYSGSHLVGCSRGMPRSPPRRDTSVSSTFAAPWRNDSFYPPLNRHGLITRGNPHPAGYRTHATDPGRREEGGEGSSEPFIQITFSRCPPFFCQWSVRCEQHSEPRRNLYSATALFL